MTNKKRQRDNMVHKRFHIHKSTNLLLVTLAELMGESYRNTIEAAILYGIAYMNTENKLKLAEWIDTVKLPDIIDVDEFIAKKADDWGELVK